MRKYANSADHHDRNTATLTSQMRHLPVFALCALLSFQGLASAAAKPHSKAQAAPKPDELNLSHKAEKISARAFGPKRKIPVFKGAFSAGLVLVQFPDTSIPALEQIKARVFNFGDMSVADYFKEYSQNTTWPELLVVGEKDFPKCVYQAPQPKGYYCEYDYWSNPLGYRNAEEGEARASQLRSAAEKHAFSFYKKPAPASGIPVQANGRPIIVCYVFATDLVPPADFRNLIRPHYKGLVKPYDKKSEAWDLYKPAINWSDPLWPSSIPQVEISGGGGTVCHEFGHVLGAPDYYHAPEKFDGVPGVPCLEWAYGPTGPGYCRYIYNAFLTARNYPTLTTNGTFTLYPRRTNPAGNKAVGCFVPSTHPNYVYYLEYVQGERAPLGNPGKQGLLIHVINVTLNSPLLGAPDICYTYRPGDPWFRSAGNSAEALWGNATGRKSFSTESEPPSRLPNLLDGGVTVDDISETGDCVSFKVRIKQIPLTAAALKDSLIPKISLDEITEVLPTSFHAKSTVLFRGEPTKSDYGFCWNIRPGPTLGPLSFSLYHRDRYGGRILGLKPNTEYYVRAYARNDEGISYSKQEIRVKTPPLKPLTNSVPPLLEDGFSNNWEIEGYHGNDADSHGNFIGSSAITTLLKLTTYYRAALTPRPPKSRDALDYKRIHTQPSHNVPPFRMKQFEEALRDCTAVADSAMMRGAAFPKDFDREFMKAFGMKAFLPSKVRPVLKLDDKSLPAVAPLIVESLAASQPVVVAQESIQLSPRSHGLSWVLIDGCNENNQFHIVYPRGHDRDFDRKTNWYPLDTLLVDVNKAYIIFGLTPPNQ